MIQKYPISIQDYGELRKGGYLYVDKTAYAYNLIQESKYYFLSRPRRFGKSLFISTLECIFKAQKDLFQNTFIYDKWDWSTKYPVIRISFSNIGHRTLGLTQAISELLDEVFQQYEISIPDTVIDKKFRILIEQLHAKYNQQVVVLIDEYDKPIIDLLGRDISKAVHNREIMKIFYSILKDADPHLKMVFITGITKFTRVSIFSDLNNLKDLSQHPRFAGICGITQPEIEAYFEEELKKYNTNEIKEWYDGYSWDLKTNVYNPYSLLNFFDSGKFQNFWFHSGTPSFLVEIAKTERLYNVEQIETTANYLEVFDIENLSPIPLLFQTGYLTYDSFDSITQIYTLKYPNKEVKQSYLEALANVYVPNKVEIPPILASRMKKALANLELDKLKTIINALFKSIPYDHWREENEHFYHAILHLTFNLMGLYTDSEIHTSDGRLDSLVRLDKAIFCFEFKLDKSAEEAIEQIISKGYLAPYKNDGRSLFAIGVNFSIKKKEIESIIWQELKTHLSN